jgi:hypothetical protein
MNKTKIFDSLQRLFVVCAMATTAVGGIYIPTKLNMLRNDGLRIEELAAKKGITMKEAARELGFRVADEVEKDDE